MGDFSQYLAAVKAFILKRKCTLSCREHGGLIIKLPVHYFGFVVGEISEQQGREHIISVFHRVQPQVYDEVKRY